MSGGLFAGMNACVSGLRGVSQSVNCHSQNIATAGAIGAKKRQAFLSVINSGTSLDGFTPSGVSAKVQHFISTKGDATKSDIDTNMALSGQGFFVTCNNAAGLSGGGRTGFTRDGTFKEDENHNFRNTAGQYLQVFPTDAKGIPLSNNLTSVSQMQTASSAGLSGKALATSKATIFGSLKSTATIGGVDASGTMPLKVFDSLGVEHTINLTFTKTAETPQTNLLGVITPGTQTWNVIASSTTNPADGVFNAPYTAGTGMDIIFDDQGKPLTINGANGAGNNAPPLTITWSSSAAPSTVALNFGSIGQSDGMRVIGEHYDLSTAPDQDGRGLGKYQSTSIDENGILSATYDNGYTEPYAKIALGTFADPNQLLEQTGGVYYGTSGSGNYILSFANQGGAGGIESGRYEESTIDTAEEFTALIVDQQRYTANLKGISTIDDMLKSLARALGA